MSNYMNNDIPQNEVETYWPTAVKQLTERAVKAEAALAKINEIRNSIIGLQTFNWSEHMYPLVAALNAAGIEGQSYPDGIKYFGTMLERTNKAEAENAALREALAEAFPFVVDSGYVVIRSERKELGDRIAALFNSNTKKE